MTQYHEPVAELDSKVRNRVRALVSLKEEIEAVAWYHQREAVCDDAELASILRHNMEEEIEHACLALEWLRRNMEGWDEMLRKFLFTSASLAEIEESPTGVETGSHEGESLSETVEGKKSFGDLGLGSLKQSK